MTLRKCRVDRPFPYHVIWCWVLIEPPPPRSIGNGLLILTDFLALNPQYPEKLSHGFVIGSTGSHSSASSPTVRVSNSFFFIHGAFHLAGCLLPFFSQA
jgi:hypothetical protein